jgi:hypothetical protein
MTISGWLSHAPWSDRCDLVGRAARAYEVLITQVASGCSGTEGRSRVASGSGHSTHHNSFCQRLVILMCILKADRSAPGLYLGSRDAGARRVASRWTTPQYPTPSRSCRVAAGMYPACRLRTPSSAKHIRQFHSPDAVASPQLQWSCTHAAPTSPRLVCLLAIVQQFCTPIYPPADSSACTKTLQHPLATMRLSMAQLCYVVLLVRRLCIRGR